MTGAFSSSEVVVHPWVERFAMRPDEELADFLRGYARIEPYSRAELPDAARMLFGALPATHPARLALDRSLAVWLMAQRGKASDPALLEYRALRQIMDALRIVSVLQLPFSSASLRSNTGLWRSWIDGLSLVPEADVRAEYYTTLALTQRTASGGQGVKKLGLEPLWLSICEQADGGLPASYLHIGLLGLRNLPDRDDMPNDRPWMTGLARWATVRRPPTAVFRQTWMALKLLYPRAPAYWRKAVQETLLQKDLRTIPMEVEECWRADVGLQSADKGGGVIKRAIEPPPLGPINDLLGRINTDEPLKKFVHEANRIVSGCERFAEVTGEAHFLLRTACNVGMRVLETGPEEERGARGKLAVEYARKALAWKPEDVFIWALWRDGLAAQDQFEAAELVGWEAIRRFPEDPQRRNQLALLLTQIPGRRDDAEHLLRETIQRFPNNPVAPIQLATLLARNAEGIASAKAVLEEAIRRDSGNSDSLRAKLDRIHESGSRAEERVTVARPDASLPASTDDDLFDQVRRSGRLRRLAARIAWNVDQDRSAQLAEIDQILREDPNSGYARFLHGELTGVCPNEAASPTVGGFGIAFLDALRREDADRLDALEQAFPDPAELFQVARVFLFQDIEAAQRAVNWLGRRSLGDARPVVALRGFLRHRLGAPPLDGADTDEIIIESAEAFLELIAANDNIRADLIEAGFSPWDMAMAA